MRDHELYSKHDTHKDVNYNKLEESHLCPVQASTVCDSSTTIADTARCKHCFLLQQQGMPFLTPSQRSNREIEVDSLEPHSLLPS